MADETFDFDRVIQRFPFLPQVKMDMLADRAKYNRRQLPDEANLIAVAQQLLTEPDTGWRLIGDISKTLRLSTQLRVAENRARFGGADTERYYCGYCGHVWDVPASNPAPTRCAMGCTRADTYLRHITIDQYGDYPQP
jgi:hypothetical protein